MMTVLITNADGSTETREWDTSVAVIEACRCAVFEAYDQIQSIEILEVRS